MANKWHVHTQKRPQKETGDGDNEATYGPASLQSGEETTTQSVLAIKKQLQ